MDLVELFLQKRRKWDCFFFSLDFIGVQLTNKNKIRQKAKGGMFYVTRQLRVTLASKIKHLTSKGLST